MIKARTGIVVPTLGTRPNYLIECLRSIRAAGDTYICVVAPSSKKLANDLEQCLWDAIIEDPKIGLAGAVNTGIEALPEFIEFCNWLGDDDLLKPGTVSDLERVLDNSDDAVLVYGNCLYIDGSGLQIWRSAFGAFAARIIRFGPCLIPQPGSLFRRKQFLFLGGLNPNLGWAFDFDLFIRMSKIGKLVHLDADVSAFRWHSDSLTVSERRKSVAEASVVRNANYSPLIKKVAKIWEPVLRLTTFYGPKLFKK
jgi:GT2 family glycosyltransferase